MQHFVVHRNFSLCILWGADPDNIRKTDICYSHSQKCPIGIRKMHNFILIRKEMFGIGKNVQLAFAKCNLHDFAKRSSQLSSQILLTRQ